MASIAFVVLAGLCPILVVSSKQPVEPMLQMPDYFVKGMEQKIECTVTAEVRPLSFKWQKNGVRLFSTANTLIQQNEYSSVLTFKSISESDTGLYRCEVTTDEGRGAVEGHVQVDVPPFWLEEPHDVNIEEGKPLKLPCRAGGTPAPTYKWSKDGHALDTDRYEVAENGELSVADAKAIDAGLFTCEASNGVVPAIIKQVKVRVQLRPRVKLARTVVHVERGGVVALKCSATGTYPIGIEWTYNGKYLQKNSSESEITVQREPDQMISNLVIREVNPIHSGRYVCIAKNFVGKGQAEARVVVQEPAEIPEGLQISETKSRSVHVTWMPPKRVPATGYDVWYWSHRDSSRFNISVAGSSTTAEISGLHPATGYQLYIVAHSGIGPRVQSSTIKFRTKDDSPSEAPSDIKIDLTSHSHALISWVPPPKSTWNSISLTSYVIGYRPADSSRPYSFRTVRADQTSYALRGLMKHTHYSVVLKASNAVGHSPESSEMTFYTEDDDSESKLHLHLMALTGRSATLSWSSSPLEVTGYTIYSRHEAQTEWNTKFIDDPAQNTYDMAGLRSGERYEIYVVAHTKRGMSDTSEVVTVRVPGSNKNSATSFDPSVLFAHGHIMYILLSLIFLILTIVIVLFITSIYMCVRKGPPVHQATLRRRQSAVTAPDYGHFYGRTTVRRQLPPDVVGAPTNDNEYAEIHPYTSYSVLEP